MILKSKPKFIVLLIIIIVTLVLLWLGFGQRSTKQHRVILPVSVKLAKVEQKSMPVLITLPGVVMPAKTVSIKSQIAGTIQKVNFQYGDEVANNQLLFEIDPAPFIATLKQAQANLAQDNALLSSLKNDLDRYSILIKKGYVSAQQYEQAQSSYDSQLAKVAADTQAVRQAQISLNYTKITAPISGKTGNVTVKPGDLVSINSDDPLVVINQVNPIEVDFNLPQNSLPRLHRYYPQHPITIDVWNEKLTRQLAKGTLTFIDNQINNQTGTLLLKASVDNTAHKLWPGQFVAVQMILTIEADAIVIPTSAIQSDEQGNFVYAVHNKRAMVTRVVVDRQMNDQSVIKSGLKPGQTIVAVGPPDLTGNQIVKAESVL